MSQAVYMWGNESSMVQLIPTEVVSVRWDIADQGRAKALEDPSNAVVLCNDVSGMEDALVLDCMARLGTDYLDLHFCFELKNKFFIIEDIEGNYQPNNLLLMKAFINWWDSWSKELCKTIVTPHLHRLYTILFVILYIKSVTTQYTKAVTKE